ncbi:MAG TPA: sigma-70 family RNA polymerase sigma factor, partial [Microthrixaceae bacterium]|nr:sigma-70 family RNA polymerase sigma factor [Microthrixaceae bacterium]
TGRDRLAAVGRALAGLDETSRAVVVLREVEGMSYQEIADALDVPVPTVKTRLLRARRALQAVDRDEEDT